MTTYIAPGLPTCDACFVCHECGRTVCANTEVVLCSCTDDPCCSDCCDGSHA